MSTITFPPSKPGKESPAPDWLGDCCGLRPITLAWPKNPYLIGVLCQNPDCINHRWGVLAYDVDVARKWNQYRYTQEEIAERQAAKATKEEEK